MLHINLFVSLLIGWLNLQAKPYQSTPMPPTPPVVRAVLFFSTSCGHCAYVIQEALPPILRKYGDQVHIVGVDISQPDGQLLFQATIQRFGMESGPVPTLVVGNSVLIGSADIPEKFPLLIEHYLAEGGVGWPDIPGLAEALSAAQTAQAQIATSPTTSTTPTEAFASSVTVTPFPAPTTANLILTDKADTSLRGRISLDPVGNTLAIVVLIGMVASVIGASIYFHNTSGESLTGLRDWAIPVICVLGMGIAGYLAYVETAQVSAVCGPVGDCNTVQQSEYARLFGVLPIGVLGITGYVFIMLAWCIGQFTKQPLASYGNLAVMGMAAFGTFFSIYLTFLEPFVIGAICAWCLTSAVLMTALLWWSIQPGKLALSTLLRKSKDHPVIDGHNSK